MSVGKHILESPQDCARRLAKVLDRPRWSPPGNASWLHQDEERPWPKAARDEEVARAVREVTEALLEARPPISPPG